VQSAGERFITLLMAARAPLPTTTKPAVTPQLVSLASVRGPDASPGVSVAGGALLVLLAAACIVRVPALHRFGRD
jgi:hypothetical protein